MATAFAFEHEVAFDPERAGEILRGMPEQPGVFALFGHNATDQPYVMRGADLRRRMVRLLNPPPPKPVAPPAEQDGSAAFAPPAPASRRLNLQSRVARVAWTVTGSEFGSLLLLYRASQALFGAEEARRRLKLRSPWFVRLSTEAAHPRLYVTNRLGRRAWDDLYGPFPSRAAAERYVEAVLDLFKLRRCHELLVVSPEHPGCIYGEMKRCMAPCNLGSTAEEYGDEARAVKQFLDTRGESLLASVAAEREAASEAMDFERAAALHVRWEKVKGVAGERDELVTALSHLRAVIVQPAPRAAESRINPLQSTSRAANDEGAQPNPSPGKDLGASEAGRFSAVPLAEPTAALRADPTEDHTADPERALLYLFAGAQFTGPEPLSTRGVRAVREQTAVGSSLFAQPLMLAAVPLGEPAAPAEDAGIVPGERDDAARGVAAVHLPPEARLLSALEALKHGGADTAERDPQVVADQLALLRRWYYRPEKQRSGELFLPTPDGRWPLRRILNGAARAALGDPKSMQATDREGARAAKTRLLHPGREGVTREVPVLRAAVAEAAAGAADAPVFRSRRGRGRTA